jgi:dipeptidyl-peptidase-4
MSKNTIPWGVLATTVALASGAAYADDLTFERLRADPPVSGPAALGVTVAPDGARVTFLRSRSDNQDVLDLWQIERDGGEPRLLLRQEDLTSGAVELTAEEQAERQRRRVRQTGITSYSYDETGRRLVIPLAGRLYIYDFATQRVITLAGDGARLNAKLSPNGEHVAFVRDRNVWIHDIATGAESPLTESGSESIVNGLAEFIAQEEMSRYDGFWWSPDSRRIAFAQYDETRVHELERVAIGGDGATLTTQRYPLAGTSNVGVRVGVVSLDERRTQWVDLGPDADIYVPRVDWNEDGTRLYVQRQPRSQQRLDLLGVDPSTGRSTVVLTETAASWINLHDDFKPLPDGGFLWSSERRGYRHLYLYDADARRATALTSGEWVVDAIECVDSAAQRVYFTGWHDDPLRRDLYRIGLDGRSPSRPERLSAGNGVHDIAAAADCSLYVDTYSDPDQPPQTSLHDAEGKRLRWLLENALDADHPYAPFLAGHVTPEFGTIAAEDGSRLHFRLHRPAAFDATRRYPAIVMVYGGPGVQRVARAWGPLDSAIYANAGYVVFALDNRGSARRGVRFEGHLHGKLGDVETRDQLAGIRHLSSLPYVDSSRIGVMGWSYGGYMTVMLLAKGGAAVAAGIAGAPVTDWRLYDTHYTERYLGLPADNAEGYDQSSVFPYLSGIKGSLLLIHGMADDNVFFTNSTKLMQALQRANVPFDLMTYPGETHFISNRTARLHADLAGLRFFDRVLRAAEQ